MKVCCGSREKGQANDIPATLVVEYYNMCEHQVHKLISSDSFEHLMVS